MGTAAKIGLAAGVAVLAAGGVVAWRTRSDGPRAPSRSAAVAESVRLPGPEPVEAPPVPQTPGVPVPGPAPATPAEPEPAGPSIEERLAESPAEIVYDNATVGSALADLAARLRLEPRYETELLRQACFDTPFAVRFRTIPIRDVLTMAVRNVKSPVEGKCLLWEVRGDRLFVLLGDPPPPRKPTAEEVKARETKGSALLERIRSEKTSFSFDGQNLAEACQYLSARHGMNIVTDREIHERVKTLTLKLTVRDVPLAEGFDEILRCDPDLAWEVRGTLVLIRKR